jgi:hypothetical protein
MKQETRSLLPLFVCFVVFVIALIIPTVFLRDLSAWAILIGLAPFGLVQLVALYFIVDAFTQAAPIDLMN